MLNNSISYKLAVLKPVVEKPVIAKPVVKPVIAIPKWRHLTTYDYTLTPTEQIEYEKMSESMQCNCICCDDGIAATKILKRLVVACQRCMCCCGDEAYWFSDKCFAINRQGKVLFIGEN